MTFAFLLFSLLGNTVAVLLIFVTGRYKALVFQSYDFHKSQIFIFRNVLFEL